MKDDLAQRAYYRLAPGGWARGLEPGKCYKTINPREGPGQLDMVLLVDDWGIVHGPFHVSQLERCTDMEA